MNLPNPFLFSSQETTRKLWKHIKTFTASFQKTLNVIRPICLTIFNWNLQRQQMICWSDGEENKNVLRLSRPAFLGEAVHGHGIEGSARIHRQAEEGGEDEGDQRAGMSMKVVTPFQFFFYLLSHSVFLGIWWTQEVICFLHLQFVWNKQNISCGILWYGKNMAVS